MALELGRELEVRHHTVGRARNGGVAGDRCPNRSASRQWGISIAAASLVVRKEHSSHPGLRYGYNPVLRGGGVGNRVSQIASAMELVGTDARRCCFQVAGFHGWRGDGPRPGQGGLGGECRLGLGSFRTGPSPSRPVVGSSPFPFQVGFGSIRGARLPREQCHAPQPASTQPGNRVDSRLLPQTTQPRAAQILPQAATHGSKTWVRVGPNT